MHANLGQLHGSADINIEINKAISGVVHTSHHMCAKSLH
jgi:hypothetical protein